MTSKDWPSLPYDDWVPTCSALHLWCQVLGKYKVAHSPWLNHSWHVTFEISPAGMASGLIPDAGGIEIKLDLHRHECVGETADGRRSSFPLESMSTAEFYDRFRSLMRELEGSPHFDRRPNELPEAVPFDEDKSQRYYDREAVERFHRALVSISLVLAQFRTSFIGKSSPAHFFWGSFDLAVTRFSGRPAPLHPGGISNLLDAIVQEAYSHEVSSAGFWPGGGGPVQEPCFYSYAYPEPKDFRRAKVSPEAAYYHEELGEFLLPYESVRSSSRPEAVLLEFLRSTYAAAADLGDWDREKLDCPEGRAGEPRPVMVPPQVTGS